MIVLDINTDATVVLTNKLEKMHRSALPIAIRNTLNKAAFDVKQKTMPESADRAFVKRAPNFFKANSRVQMATGFQVSMMRAVVGFTPDSLRGNHNFSVAELEQQEYGGEIAKRTFIPLDPARGGSATKLVRPQNRLSEIDGIINSDQGNGSKAARFVRAAFRAGKGGHVISNFGKKKLYRIESVSRSTGKLNLKTKALYSFRKGRTVRVGATGFMRLASMKSAGFMDRFYAQEARRVIERAFK